MNYLLNEDVYSQDLQKIDRKIEASVSEISKFLRDFVENNSSQSKSVPVRRKEDDDDGENRELLNFFHTLLTFLHENFGFEELLLPHIGELRMQNGLNLSTYPVRPCSCIEGGKSHGPLAKSRNTSGASVIAFWELLSSHLEDYVSQKLVLLFEFPIWSEMRSQAWLNYLNTLHVIWTPSRLWEFHKKMRKQYLRQFCCPCIVGEQQYCLECLMLVCLQCLTEDAEMVGMGCFQPAVVTWTELYSLYGEKISNYATKLFYSISETFRDPTKSTLPKVLKCLVKSKSSCEGEMLSMQKRFSIVEPVERQTFGRTEDDINRKSFHRDMLNILLKMIEIFNFYDKQVILLAGTEALTTKSSLKGALTTLPDASPEESPVHQQSIHPDEFSFLWDWKSVVVNEGLLTIVQKLLQQQISELVLININKEWALFQSSSKLSLVPASYNGQTYQVMKSIALIIDELDKYIPVLSVSQGVFLPFQSSFNHVIHTYLIDIFSHVNRVTADVPFGVNIECLYTALSSYIFLKTKLSLYVSSMAGGNVNLESAISAVEQKISQEIENFKLKITTWHLKIVVCGILHDAESHDWQNNKAFFEGERISFSIQMWNLHLKALRCDLVKGLPLEFAREVFRTILEESLLMFEARYARAVPSEARVTQFRADITSILFCTMELLPFACNSLNELLGIPEAELPGNDGLVANIHSHCCSLILTLAVVTCPFSNICRTFKKGFPQISTTARKVKRLPVRISRWLQWIQPLLFPQGPTVISSVQVWLCTKLSIIQPALSPYLTVQALSTYACTLSILLLTQSIQNDQISLECRTRLCRGILFVLKHCMHQPESISSVLLPIIQFSNTWDVFDGYLAVGNSWSSRPWWYKCIVDLINPMVKGVLCSVLPKYFQQSTVLFSSNLEQWRTVYLHMRRVIRCCCNNQVAIDRSTLTAMCSVELLQLMVDHIQTLPMPLLVSLASLRTHLQKANATLKPISDSVGVQILVDVMYNSLKSEVTLGECMGMMLSESCVQLCSEVADCFIGLAVPKGKEKDQNVPPWCTESANLCLSRMQVVFKNSFPESSDKLVDGEDVWEERYLQMMVTNLLQEDGSRETLDYLHHILCKNEQWIRQSLGIPETLATDSTVNSVTPSPIPNSPPDGTEGVEPQPEDSESIGAEGVAHSSEKIEVIKTKSANSVMPIVRLTLDLEEKQLNDEELNVLEEFCKIGSTTLNHVTLMNFRYPWESLLSYLPLLGLTETMFTSLLYHRWEIHDTSVLSETDRLRVETLKTVFILEKHTSTKEALKL